MSHNFVDGWRAILQRNLNVAEMAGKHGNIGISPAAYWAVTHDVGDCEFIECDCDDLIRHAQANLLYGHNLCHQRSHPFEDEMNQLIIGAYQHQPEYKGYAKEWYKERLRREAA